MALSGAHRCCPSWCLGTARDGGLQLSDLLPVVHAGDARSEEFSCVLSSANPGVPLALGDSK